MVPKPVAYIAVVRKSDAVLEKIATRRGITPWEVDEAVVLCDVLASAWDYDADRGWRLLVTGTTAEGRVLYVVLYAVDEDDGTWNLGTAIRQED